MKRKVFVFAVINGVLQIVKGLTARQASCYALSESLIEQGGYVVDWTAKADDEVRQLRAMFDPSYPQYTGSATTITLPMPYTKARTEARTGQMAAVEGVQQKALVDVWDFSKLPQVQHASAISLFKADKYEDLRTMLKAAGVLTAACGTCNINKKTKKWMTWAIETGAIK